MVPGVRGGRMVDMDVDVDMDLGDRVAEVLVGAGRGVRAEERSLVLWRGERKGWGFKEVGGRRLEEG